MKLIEPPVGGFFLQKEAAGSPLLFVDKVVGQPVLILIVMKTVVLPREAHYLGILLQLKGDIA